MVDLIALVERVAHAYRTPPDELAEMKRLALADPEAAWSAFLATAPSLTAADLATVPARLAMLPGPVVAYQTLVRDYLPPDVAAAYDAGMRAWVGPGRMWVELEYVPGGAPCGIVRHDERGDTLIATCGYHPTALTPA